MPKIHLDLTWDEFLTKAEHGTRIWARQSSQRERDSSWSGTRTFFEACEIAHNGWKEGRDHMTRGLEIASKTNHESYAPAQWFDVAGSYPNVPMFCAGALDCMVNQGDSLKARKPIIRLLIQVGANCSTTREQFVNYGAAVLSWIDSLESDGFQVELNAAIQTNQTSNKESRDYLSAIIKLKEAGESLEIDRIAFVLCHPSFFRRLWFATLEQFPEFESGMSFSYGYQQTLKPERQEGYIFIDGISNDSQIRRELVTQDRAVKAIAPIIERAVNG